MVLLQDLCNDASHKLFIYVTFLHFSNTILVRIVAIRNDLTSCHRRGGYITFFLLNFVLGKIYVIKSFLYQIYLLILQRHLVILGDFE